ncbi:glycoside hydrolase family 3 N-terminal domain-containing protein [Lacticaseibacillus parakribbianus]|uniref:glycoside hydrolase family 3 N-terminal domain-containing protein n=1 Tax=Lacticaseibacillus parakribbianus TaxID=2970927 RepID=UPI0021CB024D|nr:glycoside hydrolase family 3 N-terminal domain-containing protein [Lacticaseibacillus parakribbianus]
MRKIRVWGLALTLTATLALTAVPRRAVTAATPSDAQLAQAVADMSLDEQIGQLFIARKPASDDTTAADVAKYHLGGLILFGTDMAKPTASLKAGLARFQKAASLPLLIATDQEGGTVSRLNDSPAYPTRYLSPQQAFAQGGLNAVLATATAQAKQLKALGINWNYAPIADVSSDPNSFIYARTLGQSVDSTAAYIRKVVPAIQGTGVAATLKHFPGYGSAVDTHKLFATVDRTKAQLMSHELVPFKAGIEAGVDSIMVTHIVMRQIDADLPASLSPKVITGLLRHELGFDGVIITDDLAMGAIQQYDAAHGLKTPDVLALKAGNDAIMADDYAVGIPAIKQAVQTGDVTAATVQHAVLRLLKLKRKLGLLTTADLHLPTLTLGKPTVSGNTATVAGQLTAKAAASQGVQVRQGTKLLRRTTTDEQGRFTLRLPLRATAQHLTVSVVLGTNASRVLVPQSLTLPAKAKTAGSSASTAPSKADSTADTKATDKAKPRHAAWWPWLVAGVAVVAGGVGVAWRLARPRGRHRR